MSEENKQGYTKIDTTEKDITSDDDDVMRTVEIYSFVIDYENISDEKICDSVITFVDWLNQKIIDHEANWQYESKEEIPQIISHSPNHVNKDHLKDFMKVLGLMTQTVAGSFNKNEITERCEEFSNSYILALPHTENENTNCTCGCTIL